jgi:hypothetical protein
MFRREPIHKRLAREGGLEAPGGSRRQPPEPAPAEQDSAADPNFAEPGPRFGLSGVDGIPRPRQWDAVAPAEAPGLTGDEVHFVALPNGDLVVDEDQPENALTPLAETVEQTVRPPYRAEAVRRDGDTWAVAARRIDVATFESPGDEIELVRNAEGHQLSIDGERVFGSVGELDLIGAREGRSFVVRARRLEGTLWEVQAEPL